MTLPVRVIAVCYCLLLVYCLVWIPWCGSYHVSGAYRGHTYYRLGYGWLWAGPQTVVQEPDPSTLTSPSAGNTNRASGFNVVGEESMHTVVQSGLTYAEPDLRVIVLRITAASALAAAAFFMAAATRERGQ